MQILALSLPFLAFLTLSQSAYSGRGSGSSYSSSTNYGERLTSTIGENNEKGYKVTITLEDAFGQVAKDLVLIKEMASDIKTLKAMVDDMSLDMKEMRGGSSSSGSYPQSSYQDSENFLDGDRRGSSSSTFSSSSRYNRTVTPYRPTWEVSTPKLNCAELRLSGQRRSGVYTIQPDRSLPAFEAFCDMTTDGGGWTVFQRRGVLNIPKVARESFYRNWREYENGFGSVRSDYWLGLDKISMLTEECNHELIVNITGWDNASKFARYGRFNISGKSTFYTLSVANYTGNAGDGLLQHNKMKFSTYDKQNDQNGDENCATLYKGAWWYKDCFWSNLNGEYAEDGANGVMPTRNGMEWSTRHFYSYMKTEMKIRPKC